MSEKATTSHFCYYSLAEYELLRRLCTHNAYGILGARFVETPFKQAILQFKDDECQNLTYTRLLVLRKCVDGLEKLYKQ